MNLIGFEIQSYSSWNALDTFIVHSTLDMALLHVSDSFTSHVASISKANAQVPTPVSCSNDGSKYGQSLNMTELMLSLRLYTMVIHKNLED